MMTVNFFPFPVLTTERLVLRQFTKEDAGDLFLLRSDEKLMQHIARPIAKTIDDAALLIKMFTDGINNMELVNWAITLKNDNKVIGAIGFVRMKKEHYRAEVGYMLSSHHQRKGITQEALTAVVDYGFNKMKLHSIEAMVSPLNVASINLLEKNKFTRDAHFKEDFFYEGKFLDTFVFSLLTPVK